MNNLTKSKMAQVIVQKLFKVSDINCQGAQFEIKRLMKLHTKKELLTMYQTALKCK